MQEKLIRPIMYVPDGVCPRCLTPLTIFESEIVELQLDEDGFPINHDIKYNRLYGRCPNCNSDFQVKKNGMKYSIYSKIRDILDEGKKDYEVEKSNPFGFNVKGEKDK